MPRFYLMPGNRKVFLAILILSLLAGCNEQQTREQYLESINDFTYVNIYKYRDYSYKKQPGVGRLVAAVVAAHTGKVHVLLPVTDAITGKSSRHLAVILKGATVAEIRQLKNELESYSFLRSYEPETVFYTGARISSISISDYQYAGLVLDQRNSAFLRLSASGKADLMKSEDVSLQKKDPSAAFEGSLVISGGKPDSFRIMLFQDVLDFSYLAAEGLYQRMVHKIERTDASLWQIVRPVEIAGSL